MAKSIFRQVLDALAYANVGTLSEFQRTLDREEPLPRALDDGTREAPATVRAQANVILFPAAEKRAAAYSDDRQMSCSLPR